jgi:hypothetical protein
MGLWASADVPGTQGISSIKEDKQNKRNIREVTMQIDSGAKRTICNNKNAIQNYTVHNEPKHMIGITGDQLEILGEGKIGSLFDKVYYAPSADLIVISVEDLQNKGLTTMFPAGLGAGCYVLNEDGRIVFQTNAGYFIDVTAIDYNNDLQDNEMERVNTVRSKLGLDEKILQFTVADLQRREAYCSKEALKGKARCTEDYPVTTKQIDRHFVNFPARL